MTKKKDDKKKGKKYSSFLGQKNHLSFLTFCMQIKTEKKIKEWVNKNRKKIKECTVIYPC